MGAKPGERVKSVKGVLSAKEKLMGIEVVTLDFDSASDLLRCAATDAPGQVSQVKNERDCKIA